MPDFDLTLVAQWEYEEGYDPFAERINQLQTDDEEWKAYCGKFVYSKTMVSGLWGALVGEPMKNSWTHDMSMQTAVAFITGYNGDEEVVVIPDTIDGVPVVMVNGGDFKNKEKISYLVLPATVEKVSGFSDCPRLTYVDLGGTGEVVYGASTDNPRTYHPHGVLVVGASTFENCPSLTTVVNGDMVIEIGARAFAGSGLKEFEIKSAVCKIGGFVFDGCEDLQKLTISTPASLPASICDGCASLKKVVLKYNNTTIPSCAFRDCVSLTTFPFERCSFINDHAFARTGITEVTNLPAGAKVSQYAFSACPELQKVQLSGVTVFDNAQGSLKLDGALKLEEIDLEAAENDLLSFEASSAPLLRSIRLVEKKCDFFFSAMGYPALETVNVTTNDSVTGGNVFLALSRLPELTSLTYTDQDGIHVKLQLIVSRCEKLKKLDITGAEHFVETTLTAEQVDFSDFDFLNLGNVTSWKLEKAYGLKNLVVPWYMAEIGSIADLPALETLTLSEGIEEINRISDVPMLSEITFPSTLKKIYSVTAPGTIDLTGCNPQITGWLTAGKQVILSPEMTEVKASSIHTPRLVIPGTETDPGSEWSYDTIVVVTPQGSAADRRINDQVIVKRPGEVGDNEYYVKYHIDMYSDTVVSDDRTEKLTDEAAFLRYRAGDSLTGPRIAVDMENGYTIGWKFPYAAMPEKDIEVWYSYESPTGPMDYTWEETNEGIRILKYSGKETVLSVPMMIQQKPVVSFAADFLDGTPVKTVILPASITGLSGASFSPNVGLEAVQIKNDSYCSVDGAVYACVNDEPVTLIYCPPFHGNLRIPESVTSAADNACAYNRQMTKLDIPAAMSSIESGAWLGCTKLEKVTFHADCSVADDAFAGCGNVRFYGPADAAGLLAWSDRTMVEYNVFDWVIIVENDHITTSLRAGTSLADYVLPDKGEEIFRGWRDAETG